MALWAVAMCLAGAGSARAQEPWPAHIANQLQRIAEVGWRLGGAANALCQRRSAPIGAEIDYIGAYSAKDRAYVSGVLGLGDAPRIMSTVPGGPAARAGLEPGDEIVAANGRSWRAIAADLKDPALLADAMSDYIASAPTSPPLALTIRRGGNEMAVAVERQDRCAARVLLKTETRLEAYSDSANVAVSAGFVDFAANDDELALLVAHELAHILYQDKKGLPLSARRIAEDRADLAGAMLAHCAGFNVERGVAFMERLARRDRLRLLDSPTHRSMKARVTRIRSERALRDSQPCPMTALPDLAS